MACRRKSIFELERRSDFLADMDNLKKDLKATGITPASFKPMNMYQFLDESICDWPYRMAASSIRVYLDNLGIDEYADNMTDALYILELYINLLHWAPEHDKLHVNPFGSLALASEPDYNRFLENCDFILEQCNMSVREVETDGFPQYRIYKRDANVDAALEAAPELADVLLAYLDIRNDGNEAFKKQTLKQLADYLEPLRNNLKGTEYKSLSEAVFRVFNTCNIRHNDDKQLRLKKAQRISLYDRTFKMCLHLLQVKDVMEYKEMVNGLGRTTSTK